jgi:hypothetical protein
MVWELSAKFTLEFSKKFPFQPANREELDAHVVETLSLHLWIALKVLGTEEGAALDEMHRLFLESVSRDLKPGVPLAALKKNLLARYDAYYKSWKDQDGGTLQQEFVAEVQRGLFPEPHSGFDALQRVHFLTWVLGAMAAVLKMRGDADIQPQPEHRSQ